MESVDDSSRQLLMLKNLATGDPNMRVVKNDTISVTLQQAFIKNFTEIFGRNPLSPRDNTQGEIAIVAKVFELSRDTDLDFRQIGGRLVYYSNDVRRDQFVNAWNLPIYGPKTYSGAPLVLSFHILELDSSKTQIQGLLATLANAGRGPLAQASPVLNLMEQLGNAILSQTEATDDVEFTYYMALNPITSIQGNVTRAPLEAGTYVLIREDDRQNRTPWDQICYNQNTGRLECNGSEYRENSYLVIQIGKVDKGVTIDLSQTSYEEFLTHRDQLATASAEYLRQVSERTKSEVVADILFNRAKDCLNELISGYDELNVGDRLLLATTSLDILAGAIRGKMGFAEYNGIVCAQSGEQDSEEPGSEIKFAFENDKMNYLLRKINQLLEIAEAEDSVYQLVLPTRLKEEANRLKIANLIAGIK
jgi:hypothetical protein